MPPLWGVDTKRATRPLLCSRQLGYPEAAGRDRQFLAGSYHSVLVLRRENPDELSEFLAAPPRAQSGQQKSDRTTIPTGTEAHARGNAN